MGKLLSCWSKWTSSCSNVMWVKHLYGKLSLNVEQYHSWLTSYLTTSSIFKIELSYLSFNKTITKKITPPKHQGCNIWMLLTRNKTKSNVCHLTLWVFFASLHLAIVWVEQMLRKVNGSLLALLAKMQFKFKLYVHSLTKTCFFIPHSFLFSTLSLLPPPHPDSSS